MRRWASHGHAGGLDRPPRWAAGAALAFVLLGAAALSAGVSAPRVAVLLALAPLAEESIFRAGLHETLLRHGQARWLANALTALAFGAAHVALRGDPAALAVALPALLIGAVYERTRRLWHCVALHAAMNAIWLAWGLAA